MLKEDTVSTDIQDWDSLEFINIVVAVMETFKIKFSIEDLKKLKILENGNSDFSSPKKGL